MPDSGLDGMAAGALRNHSLADMQAAIAKALSDLTGNKLEVSIRNIDFGDNAVASSAKMEIMVVAAEMGDVITW